MYARNIFHVNTSLQNCNFLTFKCMFSCFFGFIPYHNFLYGQFIFLEISQLLDRTSSVQYRIYFLYVIVKFCVDWLYLFMLAWYLKKCIFFRTNLKLRVFTVKDAHAAFPPSSLIRSNFLHVRSTSVVPLKYSFSDSFASN